MPWLVVAGKHDGIGWDVVPSAYSTWSLSGPGSAAMYPRIPAGILSALNVTL
jgi:hypothetical protein